MLKYLMRLLVTKVTLVSYLLSIFIPLTVQADHTGFEVSFESIAPVRRVVRNKGFEIELGRILRKSRATAGGYDSDASHGSAGLLSARSLSPYISDGEAATESEAEGYATDASGISRYESAGSTTETVMESPTTKAWRIVLRYNQADKSPLFDTFTAVEGQKPVTVRRDDGIFSFSIVDGQLHIHRFKGKSLKSNVPSLYVPKKAEIDADILEMCTRHAVIDGRVEANSMTWTGLHESYASLHIGSTGKVIADETLAVDKLTTFSNQGYVSSRGSLKVISNVVDNIGTIRAQVTSVFEKILTFLNKGRIQSDKSLQIAAGSLTNRGDIGARKKLHITADTVDNTGAKIQTLEEHRTSKKGPAGEIVIQARSLKNDAGTISGDHQTKIVLGTQNASATSTPSSISFSNLEGVIGEGGKTILTFLQEAAVSALGTIRGLKTYITDVSGSTTLRLAKGRVEGAESVRIKSTNLQAPEVQVATPTFYGSFADATMDPQTEVGRTIIDLPREGNYTLPTAYETTGIIELWQAGLASEEDVKAAMVRLYGPDGLLEPAAKQTIHINKNIKARGLKVYAPEAILRFGEEIEGKPEVSVILEDAIRAYVHTFDLEKAALIATSAFVHAPMGIRIGRLVRDTTRDVFATFSKHGQQSWSFKLGSHIGGSPWYDFMGTRVDGVYDGLHLVRMPVAITNGSTLKITTQTELKGPLLQQGKFKTHDLILESAKPSVLEASTTIVDRNFTLNGVQNLLLRPITGVLHFIYSGTPHAYQFMGSDVATLRVKGTLTTDPATVIQNRASIFHVQASTIEPKWEPFESSLFQKIMGDKDLLPDTIYTDLDLRTRRYEGLKIIRHVLREKGLLPWYNTIIPDDEVVANFVFLHLLAYPQVKSFYDHYDADLNFARWYFVDLFNSGIDSYTTLKPLSFLRRTNNFEEAQKLFLPQTTIGTPITIAADGREFASHLTAPAMLIAVGDRGAIIKPPRNSYHGHYQSPIADLLAKPLSPISVETFRNLQRAMMESGVPRSVSRYRDRFDHHEGTAQAFYDVIQDQKIVHSRAGVYRQDGHAVYTLSPQLLIERVQEACYEKLNRGYIYHGRPIDEAMVQEMHRNAVELFHGMGGDPESFALVVRGAASKASSFTKPFIYYEEIVNEDGELELLAKPVFPPQMMEAANSSPFHTKFLAMLPIGMGVEQLLLAFHQTPAILDKVVNRFLPPEEARRYLTDVAAAVPDAEDALAIRAGDAMVPVGPRASAPGVATGGAIDIFADLDIEQIAIVALGALKVHGAKLSGQNVLLASLNDVVSIISEKVRHHSGGRMWEQVGRRASIIAEEFIGIYGRDIVLQSVVTESGLDTYIHALSRIYNIPLELMWKTVNGYRGKKGWVHEEHSGTNNLPSSHTAGRAFITESGDSTTMYAPRIKAQTASLRAGGDMRVTDVHNVQNHSISVHNKGSTFSRSYRSHEASSSVTSQGSYFDIARIFDIRGRTVSLINPTIRAIKTIVDTGGAGEVLIAMGENLFSASRTMSRSDAFWQTTKSGAEARRTYVPFSVEGDVEVNTGRLLVQEKSGLPSTFSTRIKLLRGETIPHYLTDWHHAQAVSHSGPTALTSGLVALGVGLASAGTLGPGAATAMGAAKGSITAAVINAGVSCMASQFAVSTLHNPGDVLGNLKSLTTTDSLRATAVVMATAGISKWAGDKLRLTSNPTGWQHAKHAAVHATAGTVSGMVIGGEDISSSLEYAARGMVAGTIGGMAANQISGWYGAYEQAYWVHKFAHFGLGGVMGAIQYGTKGIIGGAIGGMAAEMSMEAMVDRDAVTHSAACKASESMERMPYEERLTIDPITKRALFYDAARSEVQTQRDLSHFIGAAAGALAGGHVGAGSLTASNAVDHNFLFLLALGGIALEGISLYDAYEEDGIEGAVQQFRRDREMVLAMGGAPVPVNGIKVVGKYSKRVYSAVKGLGRSGVGTAAGMEASADVIGGTGVARSLPKALIHGNSKAYVGETHVYVIRDSHGNVVKVGESMRGVNKHGLSIRAEEQRRRLEKITDRQYVTEIRETFTTKADARTYETELIERYRSMWGKDKLPGNKGNR